MNQSEAGKGFYRLWAVSFSLPRKTLKDEENNRTFARHERHN